jgi:hypothetical protein
MLAPDRFDPTAHMADAAPAMGLVLERVVRPGWLPSLP